MNQAPDSVKRTERSYQTIMSVICALALLLFSVGSALAHVTALSYIVLVAFFAFAVIATRSKLVVILLAVLGGLGLLTMPTSAIAYLFCAVGIIAITAAVIRNGQHLVLLALPAAYLICFGVTGDPLGALGALLFVPPALVMGLLLKKDARRGVLISGTTVCIAILAVISLYFAITSLTDLPIRDFVGEYIDAFRTALVSEMLPLFEEMQMPVTEEDIVSVINATIRMLPAVFVIVCLLIAYLASLLAVHLCGIKKDAPLKRRTVLFRMEPVSAILFIVSFLLTLLLVGDKEWVGIASVTALNLNLILLPGLALQGLLSIIERLHASGVRPGPFGIMLFIAAALFAGSLLPYLLAFMGTFHLLKKNRFQAENRNP